MKLALVPASVWLGLIACAALWGWSQTVLPVKPAGPAKSPDEAVVLSPFEVTAKATISICPAAGTLPSPACSVGCRTTSP